MKKFYYLVAFVLIAVICANIFYGLRIYKQQINFHTNMLMNQTQICGWEIEQSGYEFENEINYIVFSSDIASFFNNDKDLDLKVKKLELFYFKYQNLIKNIQLIDNNKNVYSLFKDKTNHFISDYYISQRQKELLSRERISQNNDGSYTFVLPVFQDNKPVLNILIKADIKNYVNSVFENYHLGNTLWQWLFEKNGTVISNNLVKKDSIKFTRLDKITKDISNGLNGSIIHKASYKTTTNKYLTAYYPVRILSKDIGIAFSLETEIIINSIITNSLIVGASTIIVLVLIIIMFLFFIRKKNKQTEVVLQSESAMQKILESLPIGIMILDQNKIVKNVNKTATDIFGLKDENELKGKNIGDQFLISRNFQDSDSFAYTDNLNQYVYYDDNDNEIIIYKKEIPFVIDNEEISLEAFIDITPIEIARKREVAANKAKSEFLAKMSHEIRTPLNGIIGMANTLENLKLDVKQSDAVHIILKSADLLLSIINDILDFSKIEAGKMIIEETPFKLREEVDSIVSLFNPAAQEKNLQLIADIQNSVPNKLIGDPFRLKQVISNLIGNAIKFTYEGKILVTVDLIKQQNGYLSILFSIEDTGIGIPKEKLKDIFASFSQADGSTTRKYGGTGLGITISKQLVELMGGEMWVESPSTISVDPQYNGSKFSFSIQVYSNERLEKDLKISEIENYEDIKVLIINNNPDKERNLMHSFTSFDTNNTEITPKQNPFERIEASLKNEKDKIHLIVIKDSADYDGIGFARELAKKGLSDHFIVSIVSSNDQSGNYVKCKMNGVDYYLIRPYEASELFEIIQENFTGLKITDKKLPELNKLKKQVKILVAEDNIINQRVAQTLFKNLGYEINIAQNGADCVEKVKEGNFDIIFMDIMMPEKDGLEATAEIRSLGYKLPIVAMTANAREEDKTKAFNSGMNYYLAKPVRIEEIKEVLIRWFSENTI
jgi:signal transduction histidine kinase/CheY-like chemotaxis protein